MAAGTEADPLGGIRQIGLAAVELALEPRRIDQQRLRRWLACEGGKSHDPASVRREEGRHYMTMRGLEIRFERLLFGARWLLAPLYAGMVLALIAVLVVFARELIAELGHLATLTGERATLLALSLIDLSLICNLLMVVMLAGYESFVSQLHIDTQEDRPEWLGTIDFAGLKLK